MCLDEKIYLQTYCRISIEQHDFKCRSAVTNLATFAQFFLKRLDGGTQIYVSYKDITVSEFIFYYNCNYLYETIYFIIIIIIIIFKCRILLHIQTQYTKYYIIKLYMELANKLLCMETKNIDTYYKKTILRPLTQIVSLFQFQ